MLKFVLWLVGAVVMMMGLNVGLGGISTLGWLSSADFVQISNETAYGVQDNHFRFLGGVWFGVGLLFFVGGFKLDFVCSTLIYLCLLIGLAGLFRLSALDMEIVLSAAIMPSFLLEIIGFPALAYWLWRVTK
ncbi:MAG: DUF4345 domain-containing protein [Alphaproteobacteria bacterium]|nr:DUF4345 domain-containing protein [Alphaproteobacteria bacterium]